MDSIRNIATALCFALVIFGLASVVVTDKKMEKPIKYILGIVFVAVVISTVKGNSYIELPKTTFNYQNIETDKLEKVVESRYLEVAKTSTEEYIKETLKKNEINVLGLFISMDISEDNCIFINEAVVNIEGDINKAKNIIKENLGIDAVVKNEG